eukprot:1957218-Pyramimonas_sp.AAC.1
MDRGDKGARVPLGRLPVLAMRVDCVLTQLFFLSVSHLRATLFDSRTRARITSFKKMRSSAGKNKQSIQGCPP